MVELCFVFHRNAAEAKNTLEIVFNASKQNIGFLLQVPVVSSLCLIGSAVAGELVKKMTADELRAWRVDPGDEDHQPIVQEWVPGWAQQAWAGDADAGGQAIAESLEIKSFVTPSALGCQGSPSRAFVQDFCVGLNWNLCQPC